MPDHYYRSAQFIGTFLSFCFSYMGGFLGYVMVANILTIINADIGPSSEYVWVLLVYTLCQTITFTVVGRLADLFGRRWYFIGGNVLAMVGYLVSSRAKNMNTVIGGSVLSGLGTGVQISGSIVSGELVPNKYRFLSFGAIVGLFGPLMAIGPGLARTLCDRTEQGWRWVYYLVAIISFIAGLLQFVFYHPPEFHHLHTRESKRHLLKTLDYGGLIIFIGGAISLLLGISWGGQKYPWSAWQVIATIVIGGVALVCFGLYERFAPWVKHPLVPTYLFQDLNYVALGACTCVGSMVFYSLNILWPSQIGIMYGASPTAVGWMSASCTLTAGAIFGQAFGGIMTKFIGHLKWQLVCVCAVFTTFIGGMAAATPHNKGLGIAFSLISSIGIGWMEAICLTGGPLMVDPANIGVATGVQFSARTGLSTLAISIYVTILDNKVKTNLPKYVIPAALKAGLPQTSLVALFTAITSGSATAALAVPGITPQILEAATAAAQLAYTKSFQTVYFASIAFGVLSIIASVFGVTSKLDGSITSDIARKLQGVPDPTHKGNHKIDAEKADVEMRE
ncbi:siderophore iron transporter, partial [Lepidopterella palustris CBS 459.81]